MHVKLNSKSTPGSEVRHSGENSNGKPLTDMNLQLFFSLNGWMDGWISPLLHRSSSASPLKPGCWLLILCSYINMLSSRGQRWAHTALSSCQVNKEMDEDAETGRKVKDGEAGRRTSNMTEVELIWV